MSNRRLNLRFIWLLILVLVALSVAGHFVFDLSASPLAGNNGSAERNPAFLISAACNALLHSTGLIIAYASGAWWALMVLELHTQFCQIYRNWAPPTPVRPPNLSITK